MRYDPNRSVSPPATILSSDRTVTLAQKTAAPSSSRTRPWIVPPCASAGVWVTASAVSIDSTHIATVQ